MLRYLDKMLNRKEHCEECRLIPNEKGKSIFENVFLMRLILCLPHYLEGANFDSMHGS